MMERWKTILGFESYAISDHGRVKRLTAATNTTAGRVLKPVLNKVTGYYYVGFRKDGTKRNRYVHRLVAQAFIPNPDGKPDVNHKNGKQKWNNAVSNLEWLSQPEHHKHSSANDLVAFGSRSGLAKLNTKQIVTIRTMYANGHTQKAIADKYAVSRAAIGLALQDRTWARA